MDIIKANKWLRYSYSVTDYSTLPNTTVLPAYRLRITYVLPAYYLRIAYVSLTYHAVLVTY